VLAHPSKYRLTATRLRTLVADFAAAGGAGLEVVVGRQLPDITAFMAQLCRQNGLAASVGSDFHKPGYNWCELGKIDDLPKGCDPIWMRWSNIESKLLEV
jgi:predicted metal-dependent phosphoesterase TrpH